MLMSTTTTNKLPYKYETMSGRSVITLLPGLNDVPWSEIEKVGAEILDLLRAKNSPQVLVDAGPLSYMGSAQVALVVRIFKAVEQANGRLLVSYEQPMVLEILTLAGLDKVFPIVQSRNAGLEQIGVSSSAYLSSGGNGGSDGDDSLSMPLIAVSWIAMILGAVAATLYLTHVGGLPPRALILGGLVAGAISFGTGLWALMVANGQKGLALLPLLGSLLLLLFGAFQLAQPEAAMAPLKGAGPAATENPEAAKAETAPAPKASDN